MPLLFDFAKGQHGRAIRSFLLSSDVVRVLVSDVTMHGWTDAEKELESVTEIVAVVAIESVRAIVDCELGTKTNVDAIAVRQIAHVTECVGTYGKDARVCCVI
jgi:hypothetical protein